MSSPENLHQIREALASHPDIDFDIDWNNPYEVWELLAGDGEGGEGVDYRHGGKEGEIGFTQTWGKWVTRDHCTTGELDQEGDPIWDYNWTVHPTRGTAKAAYIALIEGHQAAGVTWEPDYCPIFDQVEKAWK